MKTQIEKIMSKFMYSDWWGGLASGLGAMIVSFMAPVKAFIILAIALTFVDMITGIFAAKRRGEKISSRGLGRTVSKMTLYTLAILSAEGMRVVFVPSAPFTYVAAIVICATEFKSLAENVQTFTGANLWTALKDFLNKK